MENLKSILHHIKLLLFIQNFLNSVDKFHQISIDCIVISLRNENFVNYVNRKISKGNVDLNACVVISMATSLKLHIHNGSWMLGEFYFNNKPIRRWIQVFIDYSMTEKNICYMSSCLYKNIYITNSKSNLKLKLWTELSNKFQILYSLWKNIAENFIKLDILKVLNNRSTIVCDAVKVDICLIDRSIPDNIINDNYTKCYFQTSKFVCIGDIIEINIPLAASLFANENYDQVIPPHSLRFLVENVIGEPLNGCGACINSESTMLTITKKSVLPLHLIRRSRTETSNYLKKHINVIVRHISIYMANNPSGENLQDMAMENITWCGICLLIGPSGSGKTDVVTEVAELLGFHLKWIDAYSMRGDTSGSTEAKVSKALRSTISQTIIILTNITALAKNKEGMKDSRVLESLKENMQELSKEKKSVFILATAKNKDDVADEIWTLFTYHEILHPPEMNARKEIISWVAEEYLGKLELDDRLINDLSHRGAGFLFNDFKELFARIAIKLKESEDLNVSFSDVCISIIVAMKTELSGSLNLPKIPSVNWQDVGGLDDVKKELVDTIQLPILHPHLMSSHLRRSGILLYGPPGTGKTMLAKSVAHECGLNFMSVKGPELLDMYVGQSEANVREVFKKAREASPCVIFFDELDSLAPKRGRSGDSGGVMDRIVSALLSELDSSGCESDVFVLGATNRPDLLDPALLRPGRFDKQLFINIAKGKDERLKILRAVLSKVPLSDEVQLENVLDSIPPMLSGADFYSLAMDAFYLAAGRIINAIETGICSEDAKVEVNEEDIVEVAKKIRPSVKEEQLKEYERMQIIFT